jgi:peptidase A4-like protein
LVSFSGIKADAAIGDQLKSNTPIPQGDGRAVAFDPATGRLFYTIADEPAIFITDANNSPSIRIDPGVVCGALSWDAKRNQLWCGAYDGSGDVYTINPDDGTKTFAFTFTTTDSCYGPEDDKFYDGLAYDEGPTSIDDDDSLWLSGDGARTLYHVTLTGVTIGSPFTVPNNPRSDNPGCNSGIAVDGDFLWLALQSGPGQQPHDIVQVAKSDPTTVISHFPFSSIDAPVPEGIALDVVTVPGTHALWSNQSNPLQLKLWDTTPVQVVSTRIDKQDNDLYAGYAATGTQTPLITFYKIEASWIVPLIECPALFPFAKAAYWVGLGGITAPGVQNAPLKQIGLASFCLFGNPVYAGVWEIFTDTGTEGIHYIYDPFVYPIEANDEMEASVISFRNGGYQLTLHNITADWTFSEPVTGSATENAVRTAECIVEYPPPHDSITVSLPLLGINIQVPFPIPFNDFGEFTFRECKADDNSLLLYPHLLQLTLKRDGTPLAEPLEITPPSDFTVIWRNE